MHMGSDPMPHRTLAQDRHVRVMARGHCVGRAGTTPCGHAASTKRVTGPTSRALLGQGAPNTSATRAPDSGAAGWFACRAGRFRCFAGGRLRRRPPGASRKHQTCDGPTAIRTVGPGSAKCQHTASASRDFKTAREERAGRAFLVRRLTVRPSHALLRRCTRGRKGGGAR
jgi:hypothetical protein